MILEQLYLPCLAQASYLIGDERTRSAAIVDPRRDVGIYIEEAESRGLTIRHVILTHCHADFVAGHLELHQRTGATVHVGARFEAAFEHERLADGATIEMGDVRLQVMETPGHTPESISVLVFDVAADREKPHAVLTGDTLFIGDVGRPDLMASVGITAAELGSMLYDSLREKLMKLPPETLVYPGHGAGSLCGKNLSTQTVSTMGEQLEHNYALQPMDRAAFVELVTADQPRAPAYFGFDARLNAQARPTLEQSLETSLVPVQLEDLLRRKNAGAQIVDVRDPGEFAEGHLMGSINIGLQGKFATWAGSVLASDREIILIAPYGKEEEAAVRLGRIGFDHVGGYLADGISAALAHDELVTRTRQISVRELGQRLEGDAPPTVLDVRGPGEWDTAHISGSINVPLGQLEERLGEVPRDAVLCVHCKSGYRSSVAASILESAGYENVIDVVGGFDAWTAENGTEALSCSG